MQVDYLIKRATTHRLRPQNLISIPNLTRRTGRKKKTRFRNPELTSTSYQQASTNLTRMQVIPNTNNSKNPQVAHAHSTEHHKDPTFPRRQPQQQQQRGSTARDSPRQRPTRAKSRRRPTRIEPHWAAPPWPWKFPQAATFSSPTEHLEQTAAAEEDPRGGAVRASRSGSRRGGEEDAGEGGGRGCGIH